MLKPKTEKNCKSCGRLFRPHRSTDQWCSPVCIPEDKKSGLNRRFQENKPRTPIRQASKKQARLNAQYSAARKAFLMMPENSRCAVYPERRATEVHHKMGRKGYADEAMIPLILDVRYFLAVSREGHEYIEGNPEWARERGFSISRTGKVKKK